LNTPKNSRITEAIGVIGAAIALLASASCGVRPELTAEQRVLLLTEHAERADRIREEVLDTLRRRVAVKTECMETSPTIDVLVLSGGGKYGAFGAGFLEGWGQVADGEHRRPDFDMVTGVSTGALIAPFAFLGDDLGYGEIAELYRRPAPNLAELRGLLFFLPGQLSFYDTRRLRAVVEERFDATRLHRIAERHDEHRLLLVATTNLDLGRMQIWNLGALSATGDSEETRERFQEVLMASAAIPAVFPAVMLDDALHADGGVTGQLVLAADPDLLATLLNERAAADPPMPIPRVRIWVIVNQQLNVRPEAITNSWLAIGTRGVTTLANAATISALRRLEALCQLMHARFGADFEFRWIDIPGSFELPEGLRLFDTELTNRLADEGARLGRDGGAWMTTVPPLEWGFIDRRAIVQPEASLAEE